MLCNTLSQTRDKGRSIKRKTRVKSGCVGNSSRSGREESAKRRTVVRQEIEANPRHEHLPVDTDTESIHPPAPALTG
ncbi:hypothetical protein J6590_071114 [Homalodisca vitripennis]|nr:hypothetical protein J6590_071114 [Homalodisca vitripennis]